MIIKNYNYVVTKMERWEILIEKQIWMEFCGCVLQLVCNVFVNLINARIHFKENKMS